MPNDLQSRIWKLDTPSASAVYKAPVWFEAIEWTETANAGDECIITDLAGHIVFKAKALGANDQKFSSGKGQCNGLILTTLGSGIVLIRLR